MRQFNFIDDNRHNIALIGNFLPRRCGIATFTTDLLRALERESSKSRFFTIAMNDLQNTYNYSEEVCFEVNDKEPPDFKKAANFLNATSTNVVCLQHEFGIFGGKHGSHILSLLEELRMPIVTTLHTVLANPSSHQKEVIEEIGEISERIIVMSHRATDILQKVYNISSEKISFIPHGIPNMPFVDPNYYKSHFKLDGHKVILTFGLLSPGKGLEYMIDAMPKIVEKHPDAAYVILGETHPHVRKGQEDDYRAFLIDRVKKLNMKEHVFFHDKFVELNELCEYLAATDIYVTPYLNQDQIVSGTLAYAVGTGKAVVSTPYCYAEEMLADKRGRIVPFRNSEALSEETLDLLDNDYKRHAIRKSTYTFSRKMIWEEVAKSYLQVFEEVEKQRKKSPKPHKQTKEKKDSLIEIPQPNFDHLCRMTDDVGILQHAKFEVPDRNHGYCIDDNARALIVTLAAQDLAPRNKLIRDLSYRYMSFILNAFNEKNNSFRNFMGYNRQWLEEKGSEDSHGRTIWSLGLAIKKDSPKSFSHMSLNIFRKAVAAVMGFTSARSLAFSLIGIYAYLEKFQGDLEIKRTMNQLSQKLFGYYNKNSSMDWPWIEDTATYDNGKIPQALLLSGKWMKNQAMIDAGIHSLSWLVGRQKNKKGQFMAIGNQGWLTQNNMARFDQQPLEAQSILEACICAHKITKNKKWSFDAKRCLEWFLGSNDMNIPLYDKETGGCCDGLTANGANKNQGAESTLAWIFSLLSMYAEYGYETAAETSDMISIKNTKEKTHYV